MVRLHEVYANERCPNCFSPNLRRSATPDGEFFTLREWCRCGYKIRIGDVLP